MPTSAHSPSALTVARSGRWVAAFTGWPLFALAGVIAAGSIWSRIMLSSAHAWNDIRLVRSLALAEGIPLYPGRIDGALFDVVYGPVSLPFYLPAAWLPEPKWALAAGCFTSFLIAFGAATWLLWSPRMNGGADPRLRLMAIGIACFHLLYAVAEFGVWSIHVDAPALAICGFALYFALTHGNRDGWSRSLAVSAVLAGLAPWTKQTTASLIVVLFVYFMLSGYRRSAVWFGGLATLTAVLAGAAFTARWGFDEMFLSMLEMPSRHGMEWERLSEAGRHVRDLLDIAGVCSLAILIWHVARGAPRSGEAEPGGWRQPWVLCAAAAIGLAPLASVAWLKQGGNVNNLAYIDYFLMLAGLLAMLNVCSTGFLQARPSILTGIQLALAALLAMQVLRSVPDVLRIPNDFRVFSTGNPSQIAFEYAREHPAAVYFPWHPYAVYRAERRLYHAGYPVMDRERAGMPISDGHLRRYLPPGMKYIAFLNDTGRGILSRFPEFRCSATLIGLERFEVLSRCEQQAEPAAPLE